MKIKKRLDVLLVERMYAETRSKAQAIKRRTSPAFRMKKMWKLKFVATPVPMSVVVD